MSLPLYGVVHSARLIHCMIILRHFTTHIRIHIQYIMYCWDTYELIIYDSISIYPLLSICLHTYYKMHTYRIHNVIYIYIYTCTYTVYSVCIYIYIIIMYIILCTYIYICTYECICHDSLKSWPDGTARRRLEDRGAALTTLRTAMRNYHQKAAEVHRIQEKHQCYVSFCWTYTGSDRKNSPVF